jgi:hypothetical protein
MSLVRTDVSEERVAFIIRVARMGKLGTTLAVTHSSPKLVTLIMKTIGSSKTSVLARVTRRHIPEDGILQSMIFI